MKNVLIVDDEKNIRITLSEWFKNFVNGFEPILAADGREGVAALAGNKVDLLITDLNMPKMDGFELLAHVINTYPKLPTMVMTAFGTDQIKAKVSELGVLRFLDKPLNYDELKKIDFLSLVNAKSADAEKKPSSNYSKSFVNGISLQAFLQRGEMEKKTCTLTVSSGNMTGQLFLISGELVDAETDKIQGEQAAYEMICWDNSRIEIENSCSRHEKKIEIPTMHLLMEACRIKDERLEQQAEAAAAASQVKPSAVQTGNRSICKNGLAELAVIEGFSGAILITPDGEIIQQLESANSVLDFIQAGKLANNALNEAEKSVQEIGFGSARQIHVETERHHILARCHKEDDNSLLSEQGNKHVHLAVLLTDGNSLGMAKVKMQAVIARIVNEI